MTIDLESVRFLVVRVPKIPSSRKFWRVLSNNLKERSRAEFIQSQEKLKRNNKAFDIEIVTILENVDDLDIVKNVLNQSLIDAAVADVPPRYIDRAIRRKIIPFRNNG